MSTATQPSPKPAKTSAKTVKPQTAAVSKQLRVSRYDQVSSLLIALLVMVGATVLMLFIIWLTGRLMFSRVSPPIELVEYAGRGDHAEGFERDPEEPGLEELEEMIEPQIETTLETISDVVTDTASSFDAIQTDAIATSAGKGGMGDSRGPGPLGEGDPNLIPPWDRWEIRFTTSGIDAYARQLDYFNIELGTMGGGSPNVEYASDFSRGLKKRTGKPEDEKRLYMSWQKGGGQMGAFDRQLLGRAGIGTDRRLVLQFYPKETEVLLMTAEALAAREKGHTNPREFLKTIFGVRPQGSGYEFYVIDQYFRPAPNL